MSRVFSVREVELQPGVEPHDYERFFVEAVASLPEIPGWKFHLRER
jgi:hypothetical protein